MEEPREEAASGSTDRRQRPRVDTCERQIYIDFEDEIGCRVLDLSEIGLSLLAHDRHIAGSIAALTLHIDGQMWVGAGAIQAVSRRASNSGGPLRYGIRVFDRPGTTLAAALPAIAEALRSGAASPSAMPADVDALPSIAEAASAAAVDEAAVPLRGDSHGLHDRD